MLKDSDGRVRDIFEGLSQYVPYDPATIRVLHDRVIIMDLGDLESVGNILIPETAQESAGGVGKNGLLRLGVIVAVGPGERTTESAQDEFGNGIRRWLIEKPCEACAGRGLITLDDPKLSHILPCETCGGTVKVPVTIPVQCEIGQTVIYDRHKSLELYLNGVRHQLSCASQSVLAVVEKD